MPEIEALPNQPLVAAIDAANAAKAQSLYGREPALPERDGDSVADALYVDPALRQAEDLAAGLKTVRGIIGQPDPSLLASIAASSQQIKCNMPKILSRLILLSATTTNQMIICQKQLLFSIQNAKIVFIRSKSLQAMA